MVPWLRLLLFTIAIASVPAQWLGATAMRPGRVAELRRETVDLFYHGFDNYMRVAFPEDEVLPAPPRMLIYSLRY
jgi:hypothetical protein